SQEGRGSAADRRQATLARIANVRPAAARKVAQRFVARVPHPPTFQPRRRPTTASFVIRDAKRRVYPSQAKRLAPDFPFHPQVYRGDGETLKLPDGDYTVEFSRGPESIPQTQNLKVD